MPSEVVTKLEALPEPAVWAVKPPAQALRVTRAEHHARLNAPLFPYKIALEDEQDVLRFMVSRLACSATGRMTGLQLMTQYILWAQDNNLPTLGYSDLIRLVSQMLAYAPGGKGQPGVGIEVVHGPTTIITGLVIRRDGARVATPTLPPGPTTAYADRITKAGARMGGFSATTADPDMLTLKFMELFTRQGPTDRVTQGQVLKAYQLWSKLTGVPLSQGNAVWVGLSQFAACFLNTIPRFNAPLHGMSLL